jgi:ribosomal protein S18 acetylase RimI-like enzyme
LENKGDDLLIVYEKNGRIIGFLIATVSPARTAIINDLAVIPEERGKGIASSLYEHAIRYFKSKGINFVYCWVKQDSELSRGFWKGKGFAEGNSFVFTWKVL